MLDKLLSGKNVLITGAGGTIGKSIAIEMAKQGARILFTEIDKTKCESLEKELHKYHATSTASSPILPAPETSTICLHPYRKSRFS